MQCTHTHTHTQLHWREGQCKTQFLQLSRSLKYLAYKVGLRKKANISIWQGWITRRSLSEQISFPKLSTFTFVYRTDFFSQTKHIHFCLQSRQQVLQPYLPRDRAMVRIQMEYRWRSCSSMKSWSLTSGLWTTAIWTGWADCSILPTSCTRRSSLQRRDNSCNTTSSAL